MPTLNWCYGAARPITNHRTVSDQIWLAHRYKNKLVELERDRRQAAEALAARLHPDFAAARAAYEAADKAVDAAYAAVKACRVKARKRLPPTSEQQDTIDAAKTARCELSDALKSHKAKAYGAVRDTQQPHLEAATTAVEKAIAAEDTPVSEAAKKRRISAEYHRRLSAAGLGAGEPEHRAAALTARAECKLYWGTYLQVEDAAKDFRKGPPPKFRRWQPDGSVSVQLQGGLSVADATACEDTRLRLHLPEVTERLATTGHDYGTQSEGEAWLRVGSDGRAPVWTIFKFRLHRPLPEDGVIKWAHLDRRMTGEKEEWTLRLTLQTAREKPTAGNNHLVAVHLGHHRDVGGLTVASWRGTDGRTGKLTLPDELLDRFALPHELQATRDANANVAMDELLEWIKAHSPDSEWFRERTATMSHWRGPERLAKLVTAWRDNQFADDRRLASLEEFPGLLTWAKAKIKTYREKGVPIQTDVDTVFDLLEFWRKQDKHLGQWIKSQTKKCVRRRKYLYGEFAKNLAMEYGVVAVAKVDWKGLAKSPELDDEDADEHDATSKRRVARIASPGLLSETLVARFRESIKVPAKHVKATCNLCGKVNKWTHKRPRHECRECGQTWEIRENTLSNILASGVVMHAEKTKNTGDSGDTIASPPTVRKHRSNRRASQSL